jgi:hypothetical protein
VKSFRARLAAAPLPALVSLRWRMIRDATTRRRVKVLAFLPFALMAFAVAGGLAIPAERRFSISLLLPTVAVATVLIAVIAPLVAGGGNELYPRDQLVAFPITARTTYLGSLLLAPLNAAWLLQLTLLLTVTSVAVGAVPGLALALLSMLLFTVLATVVGQTIAWTVAGLRATPRGRLWTRLILVALLAVAAAVVAAGLTSEFLDSGPPRLVVNLVFDGANLAWLSWWWATLVLVASTVLAGQLGVAAVRWGQRRPGWSSGASGSVAAGRATVRSTVDTSQLKPAHAELTAVQRSSVWRAPALRRGILVLAILPGAAAATAGLEWSTLTLLPTLTAAAAGLLFGVNVFGLDGGGATWLGSLPGWAGPVFWAKTQVVAETCAIASLLAVLGGVVRAPAAGTATEVAAVLAATAAGTCVVVAMVMRISVRHPHRAPLDGPRDAPAPPGSMAGYSLRLAVPCTIVGLAFAAVARVPEWWFPLVLAVPFVCWALASIMQTAREWEDPGAQATVLSRVSAG